MKQIWSFFTGAMGLDLGLEEAGLHSTLAVEVEPTFVRTIRANRPDLRVIEGDVSLVSERTLREETGFRGDVDLMIGGPPCQSFSPGGKRAALSDPRGNLIFEYLRLVAEVKPRQFVLENVANLVTAAIRHRPIAERPGKNWNLSTYSAQSALFSDETQPPPLEEEELSGSAIRYLLNTAVADLGYHVSLGVLNSADYGAAQKRMRFVLMGSRDMAAPALPTPTHGMANELEAYVTLKDVIADLREDPGPGSEYTEPVRAVFDLVPEGGNWRDLPDDVAREAMGERSFAAGGGKTGFFRRLSWDAPSPTITGRANRKGSALCHPEFSRPLSVRECARIQGFPDEWHFEGSVNRQYLQVGNAVPIRLGAAIGRALVSEERTDPDTQHDTMLGEAITRLRRTARNTKTRLPGD